VLYWRYVPRVFWWPDDCDLSPCPLYRNYQLVRNLLSVAVNADGMVSLDDGHVIMVYDERNPAFGEGGEGPCCLSGNPGSLERTQDAAEMQLAAHHRTHQAQ